MDQYTGTLSGTATYRHREYVALAGLGWEDGRHCTVWFQFIQAKGRRGTKAEVSRYAVSEVPEVGFNGRTFVWNKEVGDEYGPGVRKPPYAVRIDRHGEISCQCQADTCRAPSCRHMDMQLVLLAEGAFTETITGA